MPQMKEKPWQHLVLYHIVELECSDLDIKLTKLSSKQSTHRAQTPLAEEIIILQVIIVPP